MALIYSNTNNFWIKPNALNIGLNHFGNPNLIEVSLLAGAVIMAYKQDVISYNAAHNYRTWRLNASRTFLEKDERCYVYARLDRAETSNYAQVIYSYQQLDMLGRATEDATATEYYYILLGVLSPAIDSDGNKVDRIWEEGFYTGSLATDQYIKEESGGDWTKMFRLNGATGLIEVLKTINSATINVLKVATSFSLAGKTVKGIDDSKSTSSSDDHLATSGYVDANSLSSKADDTAQGKITFSQGINIGAQDITDIDTSDESFNTTKDNSLPTSKAVVKYVENNTLSSKTEDTAKGKITFENGIGIGTSDTTGIFSYGIENDGSAKMKSLELTESLIVPEIKYNRATVFKGIQYLTFGGGVIESVTPRVDRSGTLTLKLEDGEPLSVKIGDLCVGFWHFLDATNDDESKDEKNGNFKIAGFSAIYFEVSKVSDDGVIDYVLRDEYNVHPQPNLNFACYSNNIQEGQPGYDKDRHACKITTTDYEIRLQNLYDWEYSSDNIYRIEGKLDEFSMTAVHDGIRYEQGFNGHGVVFGNAYMYGTLQQFDREVWRMVLSYENDNILSGDKQLTVTVYRNDVKAEYGGNSATSGQVKLWSLKHNGTSYRDIGANGTIILSEADIPNGSDNVTFEVVATVISTGVEETNNNEGTNETNNKEIVVSQSVTFHRLKQGTEGNGIVKVEEFYLVSEKSEKITIADNTWYPTPPLTTKEQPYLWNYEKVTYTKSDPTTTDPAVIGKHGDDGRGIESITEWYGVSSDVNTEPTNWFTAPQKTDPTNKYLWNKEDIKYTDGKTETTDPAIIGTYGDKGEDGNDGKDAVQPNYMDGTSVDGTVEGNEWRVNIKDADDNPYRTHPTNPYFDGFSHITINPVTFGRVLRISGEVEASPTTVASDGYYVLQTKFDLSWVKGIVQPIGSLNNLYCYAETYFGEVLQTTGTIDVGDTTGREIKSISVQVASARTNSVPSSFSNSSLLYADYYLFIKVSATLSDGKIISKISGGIQNTTGSAVQVNASAITYYTIVDKAGKSSNIKPKQINSTDTWIGYTKNPSKPINAKINVTHGFPTNTSNLQIFLRVRGIYSTKDSYFVYRNLKAELWDEKRQENTAYIPSENDKARATNVNLLDGTRNGKNSEGKEIWTKATNNRGTITFGDNLFTLTSQQVHYEGNCMSITSPKITLLQGNYTLSFDMKMVNCYGARLVVNEISHTTIASTTDWTTHRILLARYNGDFHFRFDSMLSVAAGTTSNLYIRNIKLEEGCFGTAWTISENDKGGKPGFSYRPCGTYDPGVLYVANNEVRDAVYYKDENSNNTGWYICRESNKGQTPSPNSTYWEKSSYIKFLSVEALFADNLFAEAIQGKNGYFNGLTAEEVKISGELNATKGTFDNVVINENAIIRGKFNKVTQHITEDNFFDFFSQKKETCFTDTNADIIQALPTRLLSWGDIIYIDYVDQTLLGASGNSFIVFPALLPFFDDDNILKHRKIYGYHRQNDTDVRFTAENVRELINREFLIINNTNAKLSITSVLAKFPCEQDFGWSTRTIDPYVELVRGKEGATISQSQYVTNYIDSSSKPFGFGLGAGNALWLKYVLSETRVDADDDIYTESIALVGRTLYCSTVEEERKPLI